MDLGQDEAFLMPREEYPELFLCLSCGSTRVRPMIDVSQGQIIIQIGCLGCGAHRDFVFETEEAE
jgi:transcription elongation factor Elf1